MPAILVHGLDDALTALRAAQEVGAAVTLVSAPGAGGYAGAAWFDQVVRQASAKFPGVKVEAVLEMAPFDTARWISGTTSRRQSLRSSRLAGRR